MKKQLFALLLVSVSLAFTACEEKEDDQIFSAQQCLDSVGLSCSKDDSTCASVSNCTAMLGGNTSQKAYVIRCSADFIQAKITNKKIVDAIENLDKDKQGQNPSDPTTILLDNFKFGDLTQAETALANCTATGAKTLQVLALVAKTGTVLSSIIGNQTVADWLNSPGFNGDVNDPANAQNLENIGNAVIAMQPLACGKGGQFEGNDVCTNLNAAIANGTAPEDIAKEFFNQMK